MMNMFLTWPIVVSFRKLRTSCVDVGHMFFQARCFCVWTSWLHVPKCVISCCLFAMRAAASIHRDECNFECWGEDQLSVAQCAVSPPGQRAVVSAEDPPESEPHRRLRSLHRCWRRRLTAGTLPRAPLSWPGALLLFPHKPRAATAALRLTPPPSQVEPE